MNIVYVSIKQNLKKRNKNWTKKPQQTNKSTHKKKIKTTLNPPLPPPCQKYERGKRIWLDVARDLPPLFGSCSLVAGSLFVKNNSYHVSFLKYLVFSLWNFEAPHHSQILALEILTTSAIRYSWYLMEVFKMLPQNSQKLCFCFSPGDLYNALKILFVSKVDSAFKNNAVKWLVSWRVSLKR